jgi:nitroreductase
MKSRWFQKLGGGFLERFGLRLWSRLQFSALRSRKDQHVVRLLWEIHKERRSLLSAFEAYLVYAAARAQAKRPGAFAEVGVYKGASAKLICEAKGDKTLHLFDTFEGLPTASEHDPGVHREKQYACSIRAYKPEDVGEDLVRDLLEAAMAAPSAVAKDPWDFVVIRDRGTLTKVAEGLPNGKMIADGPVGIVVCGDLRRAHDGQLSYLLQDCSAAIENLLLAASTLGLGACWLGIHPREERIAHVRSVLGTPDGVIPVSAIAIGWPAESKGPRTRYREDAVHRETW